MKLFFKILFVFALLAFHPKLVTGKDMCYKVNGKALWSNGSAASGVRVDLWDAEGNLFNKILL